MGGLAGKATNTNIENIAVKNINKIEASASWTTHVGGLVGYSNYSFMSNIVLDNIKTIVASATKAGAYAGGFAGGLGGTQINNIALNNIDTIKAYNNDENISININVGGFVGYSNQDKIENISLSNIKNLSIENNGIQCSNSGCVSYIGGFAGDVMTMAEEGKFKNIIISNIGKLSSVGNKVNNSRVGGFVGRIIDKHNFENIYIYFNPQSNFVNAIQNGKQVTGKFASNIAKDSQVEFTNVNLYYADESNIATIEEEIGFIDENAIVIGKENEIKHSGKTFGDFQADITKFFNGQNDKPQIHYNKEGGYYTFLDETNNGNGGDNGLSDVKLSKDDFSKDILNQILGNLNFDLLKEDAESIKQSLEFLLAFIGEDGLKELFSDYDVNNSAFKEKLTLENIKILYDFFNSEEYLSNLKHLQDYYNAYSEYNKWKAAYENAINSDIKESAKKEMEKALEAMKKEEPNIQSYYAKIQESINNLGLGEIKLNHKTPILANNNTISFNLFSKSIDTNLPTDNNNPDQTINAPTASIIFKATKEVFIKPIEEEKETIEEGEGMLNRKTCYVSDNFKTNNPCMAERIITHRY